MASKLYSSVPPAFLDLAPDVFLPLLPRVSLQARRCRPPPPVARAAGKPRLGMAMRQQLEGGTGPGRTALGVSDGGKGMRVARQGVAHLVTQGGGGWSGRS